MNNEGQIQIKVVSLPDGTKQDLEAVGCSISEDNVLTYPVGTVREQLEDFPLENRYLVTLPNRVQLREVHHKGWNLGIVWKLSCP